MVEILDMIEVKTVILCTSNSILLFLISCFDHIRTFYDKVQGVFFFNKFIEEKHLENDRRGDWGKKIQNCFLRIDSR